MRPPTQHMTGDAAEAYTCNLHIAVPLGALEWTSAQGPASTAAHATVRPLGGPLPEEADSVSEGRHPDNTCVDSAARPGKVHIEEPVIPPALPTGEEHRGTPGNGMMPAARQRESRGRDSPSYYRGQNA